MKKLRKIHIFALFVLAAILLAACGSGGEQAGEEAETDDKQTASEETTSGETATERTLTDAMGHEVAIPAEPERVIASYLEDYLVALDITPVAQWSVQNGETVQGYLQDSLKDVPTIPHDLPYETVASFNPDLILMDSPSLVEGNKYDQYAKIAPTYVVGTEQNNDWREELRTIGEVFGKEDKAEQVLEEYEQKAANAKEKIQADIGNESAAAIWLVNNTFFVVSESLSSGDVLYNDLGLTAPNVVKEISANTESNWSEISLEKLAELDADHIFLVNSDKGNGAEMLQDPIWKNIPAVQNGNIYEYGEDSSWLYTGPVASSQMIDDVLESLTK